MQDLIETIETAWTRKDEGKAIRGDHGLIATLPNPDVLHDVFYRIDPMPEQVV